jgi:hypothetical protein
VLVSGVDVTSLDFSPRTPTRDLIDGRGGNILIGRGIVLRLIRRAAAREAARAMGSCCGKLDDCEKAEYFSDCGIGTGLRLMLARLTGFSGVVVAEVAGVLQEYISVLVLP